MFFQWISVKSFQSQTRYINLGSGSSLCIWKTPSGGSYETSWPDAPATVGAKSHSRDFTITCKPFSCLLEVKHQWSQQNRIICNKQECYSEISEEDIFFPTLWFCPWILQIWLETRVKPRGVQYFQKSIPDLPRMQTQLSFWLYQQIQNHIFSQQTLFFAILWKRCWRHGQTPMISPAVLHGWNLCSLFHSQDKMLVLLNVRLV